MIRRIRQFYPVPTEIARDRNQFAGRWSSTIAETRPRTGYRTPPCRSLLCHHLVADKVSGAGDGREIDAMKTFTVAVAMLALIVMPAHAQMGGKRRQGDEKKTEQKKPEVDDKAYKAALERIPEPKEKYDPWGVARPAEPAKKPKQAP
jgi:hypothetical protein